jgi:hypothetical protein
MAKYHITQQEFDSLYEQTVFAPNFRMKFKRAVIDFDKYSISDVDSFQITHFDCLSESDFLELFPDKVKAE